MYYFIYCCLSNLADIKKSYVVRMVVFASQGFMLDVFISLWWTCALQYIYIYIYIYKPFIPCNLFIYIYIIRLSSCISLYIVVWGVMGKVIQFVEHSRNNGLVNTAWLLTCYIIFIFSEYNTYIIYFIIYLLFVQ